MLRMILLLLELSVLLRLRLQLLRLPGQRGHGNRAFEQLPAAASEGAILADAESAWLCWTGLAFRACEPRLIRLQAKRVSVSTQNFTKGTTKRRRGISSVREIGPEINVQKFLDAKEHTDQPKVVAGRVALVARAVASFGGEFERIATRTEHLLARKEQNRGRGRIAREVGRG